MKDKETMLKLMRFWLFGTFIIVFVAVTLYAGVVVGTGLLILKQPMYWVIVLATAVLSVVAYYIYKGYLGRNE